MVKKKKVKKGNVILSKIQKEDPERLRDRTVKPEKGKGRKSRPRKKNWEKDSSLFDLELFLLEKRRFYIF